jgi:hypothetical protein
LKIARFLGLGAGGEAVEVKDAGRWGHSEAVYGFRV